MYKHYLHWLRHALEDLPLDFFQLLYAKVLVPSDIYEDLYPAVEL